MAINVSNLTTVPQRRQEIFGKIVRRDTILNWWQVHDNYNRGPALWRIYTAGGDLKECCNQEDGTAEFTEVLVNIACIMKRNQFCGEDLQEKLNDFEFRVTAGGESIDRMLVDIFTEQELAFLSKQIDILVAQGDTTSANPNLNKIDGLLKQARTNGIVVTPTANNIYAAIIELVRSLPADAYDMGTINVYIPTDWSQILQLGLVGMNYFHYNPGTAGIYDKFTLPGIADVEIVPWRGLNGTNQMFATPRNNVHWFTNLRNDHLTIDWDYSKYHQEWYYYVKFLLGVAFAIPDYVAITTLTTEIINGRIGLPVEIVAPLGASGGVLTETATAGAGTSARVTDFTTPASLMAALEESGFPVPAALKKAVTDTGELPIIENS